MILIEKTTILGSIPDAWEAVKLEDVFKMKSGDGLSKSNLIEGDYPVYGGNGVTFYHGNFNYSESKLIIGRVGAKCGCIHRTEKYSWITDNALVIDKSLKEHSTFFLEYILNKIDLNQYANKNAQPVISGGKIYPLVIPFPPLYEQQKIAEILSTVDDKIEVIDQQIIETQALKKGLMQRLLTKGIGHTEFKDSPLGMIPESWEVVKLEDIGSFFKGKGISKSEILQDGQFPCLRYGEIYTIYDTIIYKFQSFINQESVNNSIAFNSGDLLFTGSGETAEDIGKCVTYIGNKKPYASGDLIIHRPKKGDSKFLSYSMNSNNIRNQTKKLGQGNAVVHIYTKHLSQLTFSFPPIEEQKQIAEILTSVDEKLEVLSEKKTHYQELKQGLMQQLLTGKIRVKV